MSMRNDDSLLFVAEWYDPLPQLKKQYLLKYFPEQHMAEMVDVKSKKVFLKKSACPETLHREDFYVGSKILLYSRELEIVDFGDGKTRAALQQSLQPCLVLLPASVYAQWGEALDALTGESGEALSLAQAKTLLFSSAQAEAVCAALEANPRSLTRTLCEGVVLALLVQGEQAIDRTESALRRVYGGDASQCLFSHNGLQCSHVSSLVFDAQHTTTATLDSCTCCVIKPHAVKARHAGRILREIIAQGYEISALRTHTFEKAQAEEFLEVYKGVVPEYQDHVVQLCSGVSVMLELRAQDAVETFRVTAGPWDVEMAKELRPDSLRARFGLDRIRNAVHCTDLPEDAELECEYCFKLL